MSHILNIRLEEEQMERLLRLSHRFGKTPDETTALLVEERLREANFPLIEFRDSAVGRQAYVRSTRVAIWQVIKLIEAYESDLQAVVHHLEWPLARVEAAARYAAAFPEEIRKAIADSSPPLEELELLIPGLQVLELSVYSSL
jgi:uncharacterized protein (DUF433 family)